MAPIQGQADLLVRRPHPGLIQYRSSTGNAPQSLSGLPQACLQRAHVCRVSPFPADRCAGSKAGGRGRPKRIREDPRQSETAVGHTWLDSKHRSIHASRYVNKTHRWPGPAAVASLITATAPIGGLLGTWEKPCRSSGTVQALSDQRARLLPRRELS